MPLHLFDWMTLTLSFAFIIMGTILIVLLTLIIWLDTKSYRITGLFLIAGVVAIIVSVLTLYGIGLF